MNPVTIETARCLIMFPDNTHGYHQEAAAIRILIGLADLIGYGHLPQLAAQIEELWRDPSKAATFEQQRQAFLQWLHIPPTDQATPTDNETLSVAE